MIGYNDNQANELMETIKKSYSELADCLTDSWPKVSKTMNENWIGYDERDYERKLAKRMCDLYENSYETVQGIIKTIKGLADSWYTFQKNNKMSDSKGGASAPSKEAKLVDNPNVSLVQIKKVNISGQIKAKEGEISVNTDKGIKAGGGKVIKAALETYSGEVQTKVKALYNKMDSSKAFLGGQSGKINEYIKTIGDCVSKMITEIKDIYDCVDKLTDGAGGGYTEANQTVSSQVNKAKNTANKTKFNNI